MSIVAKVHNGTRSEAKNLCRTCRHGQVMKGAADSREIIYCGVIQDYVKFSVVECSNYTDKSQVGLHDMYQSAWVLETSKNRRTIGFVHYRDWAEKHREEQLIPGF